MRRILRARSVSWAAAVVAATTLASLVPSAAAAALPHTRPAAPQPTRAAPVNPAATLAAPADTGASDISNLGGSGWTVQSSAVATQTGAGQSFTAGKQGSEQGLQVTATPDKGETYVVLTWTEGGRG